MSTPAKPPRWLEIAHRPYGWDERDYRLAAALRTLPSFGLLGNGDWMISVRAAIELIEAQARERGQAKIARMR
jgi:hypothetical protein